MADQAERLELATVKAEIGSDIISRFSNDPVEADPIPTDSGDIQNLKQVAASIEAAGQAAVDTAVAEGIVDLGGSVAAASESADRSESASSLAAAFSNPFPSTADGLANTSGSGATNRFFSVPGTGSTLATAYRNDAGAAVEIGRAPSNVAVSELSAEIQSKVSDGISLREIDNPLWAVVVVDGNNRHAGGWRPDGTFEPVKAVLPIQTVCADKSTELLIERLVKKEVAGMFTPTSPDSGMAFAIYDDSRRCKLAVPINGPVIARVTNAVMAESVSPGAIGVSALSSDLTDMLESAGDSLYLLEPIGITPTRKVYVNSMRTGSRQLLAATDPDAPEIVDNKYVFYTETGVRKYQPAMGGTAHPVYPTSRLAFYGDSLTAASNGISDVGSVLGISVTKRGVGGQAAADIAMRQGGLPVHLSVVSNSIPASGPVAVTVISPTTGFRDNVAGGSYSFSGSIAGVAGNLVHDMEAHTWTFTRTNPGSAVSCPVGTLFVSIQSADTETDVQSLWMGRNNVGDATFKSDVLACIADCVNHLKPYNKRFIVISVTNGTTEGKTTTRYQEIIDLNQALSQAYGDRYYDLREDFIQNGLARAGITPTADDLAAIVDDRPPPSLMSDTIHPNSAGYIAQRDLFATWLINKGYFL